MRRFFQFSLSFGLLTVGFATVQAQEVHLPANAFKIVKNGDRLLATAPSGERLAAVDLTSVAIRGKVVAFTYSAKKKRFAITEKEAIAVKVFPNPAYKEINLELDGCWTYPVQLQVFDKTGNLVKRTRLDNRESSMDISSFDQGIYILKFDAQNTSAVQKLLVQ